MSATPTPHLPVGYGNALGAAPAAPGPEVTGFQFATDPTAFGPTGDASYAATTAVPAVVLDEALAAPAAPGSPVPPPVPPRRSHGGRTAVLGVLALLVLAAAAIAVVRTRPVSGPTLSATATLSSATKTATAGPAVDDRGRILAESLEAADLPTEIPAEIPSATEVPTTVIVVTPPTTATPPAPPTTTAPMPPPTTATPPATTPPTLPEPPTPKKPVIKTFTHPVKVDCSKPAEQTPHPAQLEGRERRQGHRLDRRPRTITATTPAPLGPTQCPSPAAARTPTCSPATAPTTRWSPSRS
jgi:hypothetical protein